MYKYILRDMTGYGFRRNYYAGHYNHNLIKIMSKDHAEVFDESTSAYLLASELNQLGYEFKVEVLEN